jgi:hypothetical protein
VKGSTSAWGVNRMFLTPAKFMVLMMKKNKVYSYDVSVLLFDPQVFSMILPESQSTIYSQAIPESKGGGKENSSLISPCAVGENLLTL